MKRNFDLSELTTKKARMDARTASNNTSHSQNRNPYLTVPVHPEHNLQIFLTQVRNAARRFLPKEQQSAPITKLFCEVEARLGMLKFPLAVPDRRITSSGAKRDPASGAVIHAFDCTEASKRTNRQTSTICSGISRSHYTKWAAGGISEHSPLTAALGVSPTGDLKKDLVETPFVETVYSGYPDERRVCYPGEHDPAQTQPQVIGKMEAKGKLAVQDYAIPSAPYDMRIALASEKILNAAVPHQPPPGWTSQRIKRRRSYTRRDNSIVWQIDFTEVTSTSSQPMSAPVVDYEIEMELREPFMLQLLNESNPEKIKSMTSAWSKQLWWMLTQINPLHEALDVEETLRDHPNTHAVQLAQAQCGALRQFMQNHSNNNNSGGNTAYFNSPIARPSQPPPTSLTNVKYIGCMPVNFQRHNIEEIQRSPSNAYFMSEKTDGVRHLLIFTGDTAVLLDRTMTGKQPKPLGANPKQDPFAHLVQLIKPGTVFDGEVVMNRRDRKPRPIFIVFDVLTISTTEPVLHLPFEKRLEHLHQRTCRTPQAPRDMFDPAAVADMSIALPLVLKNFVKRTEVDQLLNHVKEDKGMRTYCNGNLHNHLTDGIIFQPNLPYVCGTDVHLLKWKYLDTVTIDVELLPLLPTDEDDVLRVACLGEEGSRVDMTRHIRLPPSERMRLEADRIESGGRIAEVGFDPETGEWYYLTMRADKIAPNHISTVLGTLLELGESLTTDELRYRMSVPAGSKDTYRKDMRGMLKQLLEHQRRQLRSQHR